ncbi:MAG: FGGY-family carbohydrate kinase [Devosia sp.]|uniref:xylulokinase n=1 Tax=Devosia sp. TaxID=1871048 RepID=UPI001AC373FB|nr:FGGY-family carbohydrate kinase [Devosia sp.]MBN9317469.1 FGGY-family carbohydrate kinase [Devosia sp.]
MNVLVLDCGSSALKATIFAADGAVIASVDAGYPTEPALHRRDPLDWWRATVDAVGKLPREGIGAISLTGMMENLIAVDAAGEPAGEAVLYSDPVGATALEAVAAKLEAAGAMAILGNAPEPLMTAFKLMALGAEGATRLLPGSKDFLALRLTGVAATDASCASTTGLMDIGTRDWSDTLVDLLGIDRGLLPPVLPAEAVVGPLADAAADALGLVAGIPVFNGCGDGAATTIGSGAERPDEVSVYLGTSGWVAGVTADADRAPRPYYRLAHPLHAGLIEIAPILSAGAAAHWARHTLGLTLPESERLAAEVDAAPGSALFLPYQSGARSPFVDLEVRAGFVQVAASDSSATLYYAALEGVAFAIAANVRAMGAAGPVYLVGGGARSTVWPQVFADVLGRTVTVPKDPVLAASLGAYRVAARALGLGAGEAAVGRVLQPRPERAERIAAQARAFERATAMLRELARSD